MMATEEGDQKETCLGQDQQEGTTNKGKERQNSARSKADKETVIWTLPRVPSGKLNGSTLEVVFALPIFKARLVFVETFILRLFCARSIPVPPNNVPCT